MSSQSSDLMAALEFTASDLAANQRGTFSTGQAERFTRKRTLALILTLIVAALLGGIAVVFAVLRDDNISVGLRAVIVLIFAVPCLACLWRAWRIGQTPLIVKSATGYVEPLPESDSVTFWRSLGAIIDLLSLFGGSSSSASAAPRDYPLRVGATVMKVNAKTHAAFQSGGEWQVYYLTLRQLASTEAVVLSAEPVTKE